MLQKVCQRHINLQKVQLTYKSSKGDKILPWRTEMRYPRCRRASQLAANYSILCKLAEQGDRGKKHLLCFDTGWHQWNHSIHITWSKVYHITAISSRSFGKNAYLWPGILATWIFTVKYLMRSFIDQFGGRVACLSTFTVNQNRQGQTNKF